MSSIPIGEWSIERIIINEQPVMDDDSMQVLEIFEDEWVIHPVCQRFKVRQSTSKTASLESNGEVYYASFNVSGGELQLELTRENRDETVSIEAVAISADVFYATH